MNVIEIANTLNSLETEVRAHDVVYFSLDLHINYCGNLIYVDLDYKLTGDEDNTRRTYRLRTRYSSEDGKLESEMPGRSPIKWGGDTDEWIEVVLMDLAKHVDEIPSEGERARKAFLLQMGRAIDKGKEIGIEPEFMNPLLGMMEALSSNILTDQS